VRKVVSDFAEGTHINTSVPEQCTATDAQLMVQGATACPAGSKVGGGFVRIDTGFAGDARFLNEDVSLLNNEDELIFLFTDRASGARVVNRAVVEGSRTTTTAPPLPGTPPDGGAVDVVQLELDEISRRGGERGYITTPGECPNNRAWTNAVSFTYADGASQTVETESPCSSQGDFSFGNVKKLKRKGKARLFVNVPGAGIVELDTAGSGKRALAAAQTKQRRKRAAGPGAVRLNVTATGKKKRKLKEKGKARVRVAATFAPDGGESSTKSKRIKLIRRR
jgi:hypothetical protein